MFWGHARIHRCFDQVLPNVPRHQPSPLEVSPLNSSAAAIMPVTRAKKKSRNSSIKDVEQSSNDSQIDVSSVKIDNSKSNKVKNKRSQRITRSHLSIMNDELPVDSDEKSEDVSQSVNLKDISLNLSDKENIGKPEKKKRGRKQKKIDDEKPPSANISDDKVETDVDNVEEQAIPALPKRKNRKTKKANVIAPVQDNDNTEESMDVNDTTNNSNKNGDIATPLKRESTYIISDTDKERNTKKLTFAAASPCRLFKRENSTTIMTTPPKSICRSISVGSAGKTPMPPSDKAPDASATEEKNTVHKRSLFSETEPDIKPATKKRTFAAASPCKLFKKSKTSDPLLLKTPPKTLCRTISVGSAGRTPMPPPEKKTDTNDLPSESQTPKKKGIMLNVTHSIEKNLPTEQSGVKFASPIFNCLGKLESKTKIPTKIGSSRGLHKINKNITNEHERRKTRGITKMPKKITTTLSEAKGKKIVNMLRSTCMPSPAANSLTKPAQPVSRSKMPNFASLHKRQFEQMESIIQNKTRREERAKKLLFYTPNSQKNVKKEKSITDKDPHLVNANEYSRFGFKPISDNFKTLPNVNYQESPKTKSDVMVKVKEQATKSGSSTKVKVVKKKAENRDYITGVRTNRRFELQMKARNINT